MYKKEIFRKLDKKHDTHLYTGIQGFFIKNGHHQLENFKKNNSHLSKVLEIGAGSTPHYHFIKHTYDEYHVVETSEYVIDYHKDNNKVHLLKYDGKKLPYEDDTFNRIIISHCLEHILSPEDFLNEMMRVLKKGGILSISLPTDPGLAWRLGRLFVGLFKVSKTYNLSFDEFEYLNATEHVNSIFNLISIIRHNYSNSIEEHFYPLKVKSPDLNLIYNVHIYK
jgi:phosphatidylethanolamine/phosphatidyl-N-methylethanolamine N-methyltransferase